MDIDLDVDLDIEQTIASAPNNLIELSDARAGYRSVWDSDQDVSYRSIFVTGRGEIPSSRHLPLRTVARSVAELRLH